MNVLKRKELLILLAALLVFAAVGWFFYRPSSGEQVVAVISVDAQEYLRIDLRSAQNGVFSILEDTGKPVSFEIADGKIRFVQVTCPDHTCEKTGWCSRDGDRAVCLPNRTAVICYDER